MLLSGKISIFQKNKRAYISLLLLIMIFVLCSCSSLNDTETPTNTSTTKNDIFVDEITFDDLYDINNRIRIEINIKDEELTKLQNDYLKYSNMGSKSPIYRLCDSVTITITKNTAKIFGAAAIVCS